MATDRQIKANRRNAKQSTGPRTLAGRLTSSRNAHRHGLSLPLPVDEEMRKKIDVLVHAITGVNSSDQRFSVATRFAEAHLNIERIRDSRRKVILSVEAAEGIPDAVSLFRVLAFHRYERMALAQRKKALRALLTASDL